MISSLIIRTRQGKAETVLSELQKIPKVTTYGIHRGNNIIMVAETHDVQQLEHLIDFIRENIENVLSVAPTYINFEEAAE